MPCGRRAAARFPPPPESGCSQAPGMPQPAWTSTAAAISTSVLSVVPVGTRNRDTMRAMLAATLAGLAAGLIHVLSGPDHLAAVAPLAGGRGRAWRAGFLWGLGHSGGVLAVGLLALALRGALPIDALSLHGASASSASPSSASACGASRACCAARSTRTCTSAPPPPSACCTASPAARTSSACCRRWRCRRPPRRSAICPGSRSAPSPR